MFFIGLLFKISPTLVIGEFIMGILTTLPTRLISVVGLKYIIDVVTEGENLTRIFYAVAIIALVLIGSKVFAWIFQEFFWNMAKEKVYYGLNKILYEKARQLDLESYDDPEFYNSFILTIESSSDNITNLLGLVRNYVGNLISFFTIAGVMLTIDPWCLVIILVFIGAFLPLSKKRGALQMARRRDNTEYHRRSDYFQRIFYLQDYAKELRLSGAGKMIETRYNRNIIDRLTTISPYLTKQWKLYFCQEALPMTLLIYLGISLLMGYRAIVTKEVTMGDFAATFNGATAISTSVFAITSQFAIVLRENSLYVDKFRSFMNAKEKLVSGDKTTVYKKPPVIKFENVSFKYPGTEKYVLKNINLEIAPYKKVALVGYNGAGKTTLTNLLLRLYDVTDGAITIDGVNIKEWDIVSYHKNFAAVFQDFSIFSATLGENVSMNDSHDKEKTFEALKSAHFDRNLPNGTDSILLREFDDDGISLSGGEAQKIAIARAFYKNCAFAILDEPSANLDPIAEHTLNQSMVKAANQKTVLFISHRLSTTVMADEIYMLENGEIIEHGSHEELMEKDGKYAYMFRLQAEKYTE
jgi:ATP-binding cassette subfamily B protein